MEKYKILREYTSIVGTPEWVDVVQFYAKGATAKQTAAHFGIIHKQGFVTALAREHVKGAGHGGARSGAGNPGDEVQALRRAITEAKSISGMHTLPDPEGVFQGNYDEMRVETRNKINKTIAALKAIAAGLGCAVLLYTCS